MPKEVLSELVFIAMMFVIILLGCGTMVYLFFRQYKREKDLKNAKPPLAKAEEEGTTTDNTSETETNSRTDDPPS